jgi:hypothetical protein
MKKPRKDPVREDRIHEEAIVDAGPEEQAMGWYYYLENKISFPFKAKCVVSKITSPLARGEFVEVLRMAPEKRLHEGHACTGPMAGTETRRATLSTHRSST